MGTSSYNELRAIMEKAHHEIHLNRPYTHIKSGDVYKVAFLSLRESDLEPLVNYFNPKNEPSIIFTRSLNEFLLKFECNR